MEEGWEVEEGEEEKMEEEEEKERVGEEGIEEDIFLGGIVVVLWESEYILCVYVLLTDKHSGKSRRIKYESV